MLRGRAGALALVPPTDPVGLTPLVDLGDAVPLMRHALRSRTNTSPFAETKALTQPVFKSKSDKEIHHRNDHSAPATKSTFCGRLASDGFGIITEDAVICSCKWAFNTRQRHDLTPSRIRAVRRGDTICTRGGRNVAQLLRLPGLPPFVLVSLESDHPMPWRACKGRSECLNSSRIIRWHAWNVDFVHPKLFPIPIGLNEARNGRSMRLALGEAAPAQIDRVLLNFKLDRPWRHHLWNISSDWTFAERVPYALSDYSSPLNYYRKLRQYRFTACPEGAGIDTHRVWEALYLNVTPIVIRNNMPTLYDGLDVLVVNRWADVPSAIATYKKRRSDPERLNVRFWLSSIGASLSRETKVTAMDAMACATHSASQSGEENLFIDKFMHPTTRTSGGTYIEIGALDGHLYSNTRVLSKCYGWRGVLVEANVNNYVSLLRKLDRRNVTVSHSAVCEPPQEWTTFTVDGGAVSTDVTRVSKSFQTKWARQNRPNKTISVPCAPMSKLLGDTKHVDFFSLDVEGAELVAVQTIDFTKVTVDTFCIELDGHDPNKDAQVSSHLRQHGYNRCTTNDGRNGWFQKNCD